jgi:hypothetical protein
MSLMTEFRATGRLVLAAAMTPSRPQSIQKPIAITAFASKKVFGGQQIF